MIQEIKSMASAILETIRPVEETRIITLTLSEDEANVLVDIGRQIGGYPLDSRRGLVDNIKNALKAVGIKGIGTSDMTTKTDIFFKSGLHYEG
jgi:hypothetical protein